jgi:ribosomal RNA methyltransferase Nop2
VGTQNCTFFAKKKTPYQHKTGLYCAPNTRIRPKQAPQNIPIMGRRSKNKQGAPEPLNDRQTASPKKLGKRKLEHEDGGRPVKKVKESVGLRREKNGKKVVRFADKTKGKENVKKGKVKDVNGEDSDVAWEDVDDDDDLDLKAEAK